jgi:hypothetical protein
VTGEKDRAGRAGQGYTGCAITHHQYPTWLSGWYASQGSESSWNGPKDRARAGRVGLVGAPTARQWCGALGRSESMKTIIGHLHE